MRLTCPSCGAVYEVPDTAIPPDGREVQCTNCDHGWLQEGRSAETSSDALGGPEPGDGPPLRRPPVDPKLRQVLREEAEREMEARRQDQRRPHPIDEPPPAARPRTTPRIDPPSAAEAGLTPAARPPERPARRRRRGGGGFAAGFLLTLLLVALLAAIYVYDEEVAESLPAAAEPLAVYVAAIDEARAAVNGTTRTLVRRIEAMLPEGAAEG